jgi:hypothetical protein
MGSAIYHEEVVQFLCAAFFVRRLLYCSALLGVDEVCSQDFGLKLNWEAPTGSGLECILFLSPEMER